MTTVARDPPRFDQPPRHRPEERVVHGVDVRASRVPQRRRLWWRVVVNAAAAAAAAAASRGGRVERPADAGAVPTASSGENTSRAARRGRRERRELG